MADSVDQFLDIIDNRIEKHLNNNNCGYLRQRAAVVTEYDEDSMKAFVYFVDDENKTQYTFLNKTGEIISEGDNVKIFYTSNPAKGWIGARNGEPSIKEINTYGGEGVGRPSPWDSTSEYFNCYELRSDGTPANVAGKQGEKGYYATSKGFYTTASGQYSMAVGFAATASGRCSAVIGGDGASAGANFSFVVGAGNSISEDAIYSSEGSTASGSSNNIISNAYSQADGQHLTINRDSNVYNPRGSGMCNHAEGQNSTITNSKCCHVENWDCAIVAGDACHAEGKATTIEQRTSVGSTPTVVNECNHAEGGYGSIKDSSYCHIEGYAGSIENSTSCHVEGSNSTVNDSGSVHVEGYAHNLNNCSFSSCAGASNRMTNSNYTCVEGQNCIATNAGWSHAEGYGVRVSATYCHAEGQSTTASAQAAHAEGLGTVAGGNYSHAEGVSNKTLSECSHAGGRGCVANGFADFVHGEGLETSGDGKFQTVFGTYNIIDGIENMLFVVGNGSTGYVTQEDGSQKYVVSRSNAFAVDKDGNVFCKSINSISPDGSGQTSMFTAYTVEQAVASAKSVFASVMGV